MQNRKKYSLEKYHGPKSRHQCPECKDKYSFVRYVDEEGNMLSEEVGRCNHESSCGYHYTPRAYFADHSYRRSPDRGFRASHQRHEPRQLSVTKIGFIPKECVVQYYGMKSRFVQFLQSIYSQEEVENACQTYCLGATLRGEVIYWQIDVHGNIRTGKIMMYNANDGHRVKTKNGISWMHCRLKKIDKLPKNYMLGQCLFGEHLLAVRPEATVALVEAEKSAVICSIEFPEYVWLAVGSKSQLKPEKLLVLKGRKVILFPDVDGYEAWCSDVRKLTFCDARVSDLLESLATPEQRSAKIDIADLIIQQRQQNQ